MLWRKPDTKRDARSMADQEVVRRGKNVQIGEGIWWREKIESPFLFDMGKVLH